MAFRSNLSGSNIPSPKVFHSPSFELLNTIPLRYAESSLQMYRSSPAYTVIAAGSVMEYELVAIHEFLSVTVN